MKRVYRTRAVVDAAVGEGIALLDMAGSYGGNGAAELALGEALKGRRDKVVLAAKRSRESPRGLSLPWTS